MLILPSLTPSSTLATCCQPFQQACLYKPCCPHPEQCPRDLYLLYWYSSLCSEHARFLVHLTCTCSRATHFAISTEVVYSILSQGPYMCAMQRAAGCLLAQGQTLGNGASRSRCFAQACLHILIRAVLCRGKWNMRREVADGGQPDQVEELGMRRQCGQWWRRPDDLCGGSARQDVEHQQHALRFRLTISLRRAHCQKSTDVTGVPLPNQPTHTMVCVTL